MSESQRAEAKIPLVSIGLSVFNGERLLAEALRSVQAQTQDDFELIICDGASGDRTPVLCRDFAARDTRIRYHRGPRNLGPRASYNVALSRARGRYFKWMQHEDRLLPPCIASLQRVLEEREDVLLCNSVIGRIDPRGASRGVLESGLARADHPSAARRLAWVISDPLAPVDFYAAMGRTEVLRALGRPRFLGGERALLAQLALRGRLAQVPLMLQEARDQAARPSFWEEVSQGKPGQSLWGEYLRAVAGAKLPRDERLSCLGVLAQAWTPGYTQVQPALTQLGALLRKAPQMAGRSRTAFGQLLAQRRRI